MGNMLVLINATFNQLIKLEMENCSSRCLLEGLILSIVRPVVRRALVPGDIRSKKTTILRSFMVFDRITRGLSYSMHFYTLAATITVPIDSLRRCSFEKVQRTAPQNPAQITSNLFSSFVISRLTRPINNQPLLNPRSRFKFVSGPARLKMKRETSGSLMLHFTRVTTCRYRRTS